ncbi:MAG: type I glyceraldehyde-3-phosphate dehydrogenase [Dehalococcoidia bacterium]
MATKIGINGFGRIGRQTLRTMKLYHPNELEIVAINSPAPLETLARLLKHDSDYGHYPGTVETGDGCLIIDGKEVKVSAERDARDIPWDAAGVEIVIESAGVFRDRSKAAGHLERGARKVIITAPVKGTDEVFTIVYGVNHEEYDPASHQIVSNASCTTNCVAPVAKVIHENFGITKGFISTIHAYTTDQRLLDNSHKDARRGRSAAINIIPTSTGAASATGKVIPALEGKMDGIAYRVPTSVVSITDITVGLERRATVEEVNSTLKAAADGYLKGIMEFCEEPLVSSDFKGNPASSIVDGLSTMIADSDMVKILSWYDNEWGYAARSGDVAVFMAQKGL